MPILFDAVVEPDDLTVFSRELPTPSALSWVNEFPIEYSDDNTIDFAEIVRTNRTARYRSFDGRVHVSQRDAATERKVRLAPLGSSLALGEYERLQLEFNRNGGTRQELLVRAAYNDGEQLTNEVWNRLELAWGDTLTDGKLTIAENGLYSEADYGVPPNHLVAPGTAWSNTTTATVLTNLRDWTDTYIATNGQAPGQMRTSQVNIRRILRNKEVIDAAYGSTQGRTQVRRNELNDLLQDEGLPILVGGPTDNRVDVDGTSTRVTPDDRVFLMPTDLRELGYTALGVSATALEMAASDDSELTYEDAAGVVVVIFKEDGVPFRQYAYSDATGQPVLADAKRLMVADVA